MAKNYKHPGKVIPYTNSGSAIIYSGSIAVIGDIIGIALVDIPVGKAGSVQIEEVFHPAEK